MAPSFSSIEHWGDSLIQGNKRALAKAITLVESTKGEDNAQALQLLQYINPKRTITPVIGVAGAPGVGKSSFLEQMGLHMCKQHQIALLAIDPASQSNKGAILGDKTRMALLAQQENVFIRPSPSSIGWAGIAKKTHDIIQLCEAAPFDYIIVESVGAGQDDILMAHITDVFLLLLQPSAGDDLQAIKRGIMELADLYIITKSDNHLLAPAKQVKAHLMAVLSLLQRHKNQEEEMIFLTSIMHKGEDEDVSSYSDIVTNIQKFIKNQQHNGGFTARRQAQYETLRQFVMKDVVSTMMQEHETLKNILGQGDNNFLMRPSLTQIERDLRNLLQQKL